MEDHFRPKIVQSFYIRRKRNWSFFITIYKINYFINEFIIFNSSLRLSIFSLNLIDLNIIPYVIEFFLCFHLKLLIFLILLDLIPSNYFYFLMTTQMELHHLIPVIPPIIAASPILEN